LSAQRLTPNVEREKKAGIIAISGPAKLRLPAPDEHRSKTIWLLVSHLDLAIIRFLGQRLVASQAE
jgi:hypothetical protein